MQSPAAHTFNYISHCSDIWIMFQLTCHRKQSTNNEEILPRKVMEKELLSERDDDGGDPNTEHVDEPVVDTEILGSKSPVTKKGTREKSVLYH